ncbi:MAG: GNAT family N-acetyltransferase [bacterium]
MIRFTIQKSWNDLYPKELLEEFCKKYTVPNLRKKSKKSTLFVAISEKDILGIIGLKGNELRTFFVSPDYQGLGIGRKLFEKFEEEAKQRGLNEIKLEGSPKGEPIYEHFGFKKIGTIHKERVGIKYSDAIMKKIIHY